MIKVSYESFHPTLVLAQPAIAIDIPVENDVSIPHWFSLNEAKKFYLFCLEKFPSHIGSRSTVLDEEGFHPSDTFPSHIGSRSTRERESKHFHYFSVSIPHWFSLNGISYNHVVLVGVSIPHWFSLNDAEAWVETHNLYRFHPTLVLAQLYSSTQARVAIVPFPSHIGSRSTENSRLEPTRGPCSFHPTLVLAQRFVCK